MCWYIFVSLTQTRVTLEEGTSVEALSPSDWPVQVTETFHSLMIDLRGLAHCGWCHTWTGDTGLYKKTG